ncbi:MAG: hypothetical protein ACOYYS_19390 [Chloroflexota bacterium]
MPTIIYYRCTKCNREKMADTAQLCSACATQAIRQQNRNAIKQIGSLPRWQMTGKPWKEEGKP